MDLTARALADRLSESVGQPVIIDNQPGGNGGVAGGMVARAAPDGYTLFMAVDNNLTVNPHIYPSLAYDPFRDFTPVSIVTKSPLVLIASPSMKANSIRELIDFAKANPGKLNYASTGLGGQPHMGMELFKLMTKTDITHVPYRGTPQAMTDLIAGTVDLFLIGQSSAKAQIGGRLKMLAITSPRRSPLMPELPTMEEAGVPGYELTAWFGLMAPAKTPKDVVDRLAREVKKAAADPRFNAALAPQGMEIIASTPEETLQSLKADTQKWGEVVAATGARLKQ